MGSNGGPSSEERTAPLLNKSAQQESDISSQQYTPIGYNYGHRYFQDIVFLVLFVILVLATFAFGIFSIAHHNSNYENVGSYVYDTNSSTCTKSSVGTDQQLGWQVLLSEQLGFYQKHSELGSSRHILRDLVWTLVITVILSIPFVFGLLWLLKSYTKQIVYACLPFFVLIPVFINVFWFVACAVSRDCRESVSLALRIFIFIFVFVLCGIIVWIICANWHRIELTIRIIRTASEALRRNMGLLLVLPSLTVVLFVYFIPIIVFLVFARFNGKIIPNPKIEESGYACGGSTGVDCCLWKEDKWVPGYYTLAIITMIWSATTMVEAQVYIISGAIAQWYFSKADSSPPRSIGGSVRNAFGPSFGTVCFSGLIFAVVRIVRGAVDNARREGQEGIVYVFLRCCVDFLLSAIEFLNKFTINFAAITGESFCLSAKMVYELLKRNLLSAVVVEAISTRILLGIIFVVSVIYAIVVCAILKAATSLGGDAYFVTVLAWVLLFLILVFFVHVLDNVIDTVYICHAMDKDTGAVSKSEVYDVYVQLPVSRNNTSVLSMHRS
eukprot:Gb_22103 [translate_table: standard]